MAYLTSAQLTTIKQEINQLLAADVKSEVEGYKNTGEVNSREQEKRILLGMALEIISPFTAISSEDEDGVINNITDANLQIVIGKVYKEFFNLQYPN